MIGRQEKRRAQIKIERLGEFISAQKFEPGNIVEPRITDVEDRTRRLAQLNHTSSIDLRRHEVVARHLGDGVTDGIIQCTLRHLSARNMGNRDAREESRLRRRKDFVSVAEHDDDIGIQVGQCIGEPDHAKPHPFTRPDRRIAGQQYFYFTIDDETVGFDSLVSESELRG